MKKRLAGMLVYTVNVINNSIAVGHQFGGYDVTGKPKIACKPIRQRFTNCGDKTEARKLAWFVVHILFLIGFETHSPNNSVRVYGFCGRTVNY